MRHTTDTERHAIRAHFHTLRSHGADAESATEQTQAWALDTLPMPDCDEAWDARHDAIAAFCDELANPTDPTPPPSGSWILTEYGLATGYEVLVWPFATREEAIVAVEDAIRDVAEDEPERDVDLGAAFGDVRRLETESSTHVDEIDASYTLTEVRLPF